MNPYILLARQAIENYIKSRETTSLPAGLPEEFSNRKAGAFVTIMKDGQLRGCIGTYLPVRDNIAQEIIHNAIATATEDYRFGPIQEEELPSLSYTVYVLNAPELIKDIKELDPKKFGIIIKTGQKSGLLLPDLEGVDTVEKQISIACQKAGIDASKEKIFVYKFTVEKYGE